MNRQIASIVAPLDPTVRVPERSAPQPADVQASTGPLGGRSSVDDRAFQEVPGGRSVRGGAVLPGARG